MGIVLAGIGVLDSILVHRFGTSFALAWLNAYRLQIFAYILIVVAITQVIVHHAQFRRPEWHKYASLVSIGLVIVVLIVKNPSRFTYARVDISPLISVHGRFLESFRRSESYPAPYTFQTKLVSTNPNSSWAYGLFIESSPNSAFVKSLSRSLRPEAYLRVPNGTEPEDISIDRTRVSTMLALFGISNIISLDSNSNAAIGEWQVAKTKKYYHLIALPEAKIAEVPTLPLRAISSNWNRAVLNWWEEAGPVKDLPYDATNGQISSVEAGSTSVSMNMASYTHLKLKIDSVRPTPVLIKMTYAPGWKATGMDGSTLKIWRVAPQMMMIVATGQVDLNYR